MRVQTVITFLRCFVADYSPDQPRDENGRFASAGISPSGANKFKVRGFGSIQKLNNHWGKHKEKYAREGIITTKQQYEQRAIKLLEMPVGNGIIGHADKNGNIIRYDAARNDFVKGRPDKGIMTMFKPEDGQAYYDEMRKGDLKNGGKA